MPIGTLPELSGNSNKRTINEAGIKLIQSFEDCRLQAYQDQKGIWTIGWGHTNGVHSQMVCTQLQADNWLFEDLNETEQYLNRSLPDSVQGNQFSACVSLVYNIGIGNFLGSTLYQCLKKGDLNGASEQFLVWNKVNGTANAGLSRRRSAEQTLFNLK